MNLVEARNKATEAMMMLWRKVDRIVALKGDDIGRNGSEVSVFIEELLQDWDRYSEIKRYVASTRSISMIKKLGMSFMEADIICRDISDQIEFLDSVLDKIDIRVHDSEGNPMAEPHILICSLRSKIEDLSQLRAKIRSASESCEHEVNVTWYEDEDVEDLMRISISRKEKPSGGDSESLFKEIVHPREDAPKEPAPLPSATENVIYDEDCPICTSNRRKEIEDRFRETKFNIMLTLGGAISDGHLPRSTVPNDLRMHFDKHVEGISEMEGR